MTEIGGSVEPGFEAVADAFRANFDEHGEVGAGAAVYVGGRKVVDLWGGLADRDAGTPYTDDTLQLVFSTTKGATAACANLLAQRGDLDVDAPVAEYWPEFKAAGKADIPVRWLLCHKAGLPYVDATLTLEEALAWEPMIRALEAQAPVWEPGTAHGYHATTYGWLVGEVVKRISGKSLGTFFQEEIAQPLGLEFWIGLPDDQQHRVAPLIQWGLLGGGDETTPRDPALAKLIEQFIGPDTVLGKALGAPNNVFNAAEGGFNNPAVRAAEIPAANGVTNARSLARFYAGLTGTVDGGPAAPLLGADQVAKASQLQTEGADKCLLFDSTFGLGFFVASAFAPYGGPRAFGHTGAGGSVGFTDPEHGIGFGYVMNKMGMSLNGDPRSGGLIRAVYAAIGVEPTYVDELIALVDEADRVIEVVTRAEARARGAAARHRACYVAVLTSADELVVHRRADWKDVYPGYWDVCFGGVLGADEGWDEAAHRELLEEAGVDAPLELLGIASWEAPDARLNGRVYLGRSDGPFTCPDGEVVEVATVPLPELDAWLAVHDVCPDSVDLVVPRLPR